VLAALEPLVYYVMLGARHEAVLHAIFVFDLGGISHFAQDNVFPVTWSSDQNAMVIGSCYQPTDWDIYWTRDPCKFVMAKLEGEKLFGSSALTQAWLKAVLSHPIAYLEHRAAVTFNFLTNQNLTMWTFNVAHADQKLFADNDWFWGLKAVHDWLLPTPLFRAGTWLLLCLIWFALAWRRRATPSGAFLIATSGSALIYMLTFIPLGVAGDFRYALWAVLAVLAGITVLAAGFAGPPDREAA
jgi:hypothetical protein